jgi:hypothetical protein
MNYSLSEKGMDAIRYLKEDLNEVREFLKVRTKWVFAISCG